MADSVTSDVTDALDRLEAAFGRAPMDALLDDFGAQLRGALAALDGDARPIAHRISGTAGTLGFHALGRAWRAVEDFGPARQDAARAATVAALAILAARQRSEEDPTTSV